MRIPVFVSAPTTLSPEQDAVRSRIVKLLKRQGLEARVLGRQGYPTDYPLREVAVIAKHCSGGIILGFEQLMVTAGIAKRGSQAQMNVKMPTPWNNLEAGILFGLGLPLLMFREEGLGGGVFGNGVTDVFVQNMAPASATRAHGEELRELILEWQSRVPEHHYRL